jgi:hypothetical protein
VFRIPSELLDDVSPGGGDVRISVE